MSIQPSSSQRWGATLRERLRQIAERWSPFSRPREGGPEEERGFLSAADRPEKLHDRHQGTPRRSLRTSVWYLHRATLVWKWLLVSLVVEPILLSLSLPTDVMAIGPSLYRVELLAWGLIGLSTLFLLGDQVVRWCDRLFEMLQELSSYQRLNQWLFPLIVSLYALFEFLIKFDYFGPIALVIAVVVAYVAWQALSRQSQTEAQRIEDLIRDPFRWIELRNYQNLLISLVPLVAARLGVFLFAFLVFARGEAPLMYLPYLAIGALLIQAHRPATQLFVARCAGCARWTSRALRTIGCCPYCAPQVFIAQPVKS